MVKLEKYLLEEIMDYSWMVKYITEFIGTAFLVILGNGAVANVELKGTKGSGQSWMIIAWGYGVGVMLPLVAFGTISAQINPAFTLGLAATGLFPWVQVPFYILAQLLGAMVGQLIVVMVYRPYYLQTQDSKAILGTFATIDNLDDESQFMRGGSMINGFLNELVGSFILFFGALGLTKLFMGSQVISAIDDILKTHPITSQTTGTVYHTVSSMSVSDQVQNQITNYVGLSYGSQTIGAMVVGFLVLVLVASLGGPTGPALNPARDLGPRIIHTILPKSILGEGKGSSRWWYSWVPVVAPILAAVIAVALFKLIYKIS